MLDAMDLCTATEGSEGRVTYVINPSIMYPAVIERMKEIRNGDYPTELDSERRPKAAEKYIQQISRFPEGALDLALTPREEVPEDLDTLNLRINVLITAWKLFKFVLRENGAEVRGTNNVLSVHMLNENSGKIDVQGKPIKSAFRY